MSASTRDRLAAKLKKTELGFSRSNPELQAIADLSGLSVHTVQSAAMKRRVLTPFTEPRIRTALLGKRYVRT